jgi:2,4-dienoyl-CoA reductase-like NADH-dependent reductase (Old Yellow Enzyme family)
MTLQDIKDTIEDYVHAAKLCIEAGFDGIEIHNANGYLLDQFFCDNINKRTDAYGGSTENRARLTLEVTDAIVAAIGADKVGIRFSPFGFFQDTQPSDIIGQYGYAMEQLDTRGLAYIHVIEPRQDLQNSEVTKIQRLKDIAKERGISEDNLLSIRPFREIVKNTPLITNGGFDATNAAPAIENSEADGIVYGRYFISNPDLPERLAKGLELAPYNRNTFYSSGNEGYTDYPVYADSKL